MPDGNGRELRVSWPVTDFKDGVRFMGKLIDLLEIGEEFELQKHDGEGWLRAAIFRRLV